MRLMLLLLVLLQSSPEVRPRIRDLGVEPGIFTPGPNNAITDVEGVRVGHRMLIRDEAVRTGVTAILPHGGNLFQNKTLAAVYVGNGFGKAAGFLQIQELGNLETPIVLTSTLSVGTAVEAVVGWTLEQLGNQEVRSINAIVGETCGRGDSGGSASESAGERTLSVGSLSQIAQHRLKVLQVPGEQRDSHPVRRRGDQAVHQVDIVAEPKL